MVIFNLSELVTLWITKTCSDSTGNLRKKNSRWRRRAKIQSPICINYRCNVTLKDQNLYRYINWHEVCNYFLQFWLGIQIRFFAKVFFLNEIKHWQNIAFSSKKWNKDRKNSYSLQPYFMGFLVKTRIVKMLILPTSWTFYHHIFVKCKYW